MPSLYETTAAVGDVSSSNFTTLYNSSGLSAPNTGGGAVGGNLNVAGNLTVQGTSLLQGAVTLGSTLSLPNYTFPSPDGSTDQVLVTDGSGNLYWTDVTSIPGAAYSISATTATGGANLTLADSAGGTDSVKFAGGTNITVSRTDANTITISTVADNIPDGTANGQVLVWENSAWTASNNIVSDTSSGRFTATYKNSDAGVNSGVFARKDYGASTYTTGDGVAYAFQLDSDSQATNQIATIATTWNASAPVISLNTNINNNTTGPFVTAASFSTAQATLSGDLAVNGGDITTTQTTASVFNTTATTANAFGASTALTLAATTGTTTIRNNLVANGNINSGGIYSQTGESISMNSDNTATDSVLNFKGVTQYLKWNNTTQQFELSNATLVGGNLTANGIYSQTGESITINSDSTAADSYLYMKGSTEYLKWNNTNTRFELSDQLYTSQTDAPIVAERQTTTAASNSNELPASLVLIERVTDAGSNATDNGGAGINFVRSSGASGGSEVSYGAFGSRWYGTTNTADFSFNWSNDNFSEPTPGNFPASYQLLRLGSNNSNFLNSSIYINNSAQGTTQTATSITGGNTLVFASAHGFSIGQRIQFTSTTQRGLTQDQYYYVLSAGFTTTQCQVGLTSTGTAVALTNGTSLTLNFVDLINRVGVNTNNPAYTLDVNGSAHVNGDVIVDGDIYVSGIHVDLTTPVHQGQLLYVSNDVTPTITNSSTINFTDITYRPNFQSLVGVSGRTSGAAVVSNNTAAVNYTTGDGAALLVGVDSDAQSAITLGSYSTAYDTGGDHQIRISTSSNSFAADKATSITGSNTLVFSAAHGFSIGDKLIYTSPTQNGLTYDSTYYVISTGFTTTQCQISTTLGGSAVALTNGTGLNLWFYNGVKRLITATSSNLSLQPTTILLNATNTGIPFTGTAGLEVERGTNGANQTFAWDETYAFWRVSSDLYADNSVIGGVSLGTNGNNIYFNNENTAPAGDCFLSVQSGVSAGVAAKIKWDDTAKRWQDTTDGSTYYNLPNQNLDTTSDVNFSQVAIDNVATINTQSTTTTSTSTTSISSTTRLSQKAIIRIVDNVTGEVHMLEALAFYKGTTAYLTTYAEMYTSAALATFTADVSGGAIRILATPASTNSTTFTVARTSLS